ncbi:MAG TPA: response regulator [Steroidobacteraceae bacterium]|jgi:FixJ family two-component response regulator|nr:response regulator [Steroidobacteraceae bacterium]
MIKTQPHVAVVDDDESVRESLPDLLRQFGYTATAFGSAQEFLSSGRVQDFHCLILDIAMPGMSGPDLQRELMNRGRIPPVIFITAHADTRVHATLLKRGAVAVLIKPFGESDLLSALKSALSP